MKMKLTLPSILFLMAMMNAQAADHDPKVIIPLLKDAKMSLLQGIGLECGRWTGEHIT